MHDIYKCILIEMTPLHILLLTILVKRQKYRNKKKKIELIVKK